MRLLKLLLFVDNRPAHRENIKSLQTYLESLKAQVDFELRIVETKKQPHLVEHFKLVATPALVKIAPAPKQILAGTNLVAQLAQWWSKWQIALEKTSEIAEVSSSNGDRAIEAANLTKDDYPIDSEQSLLLSDQIFYLVKEKEELQEQVHFKDQIFAMLAHDLRSPLTAASLAIETLELLEFKENNEKNQKLKKQLLEQSHKQCGIMKNMIEDLLENSRSLSAKLEVKPHKLNIKNLCQEIIIQFSQQAEAKSQTVIEDIPQDIPFVYADAELLRQLLMNLLDNAIKYTPQKGTITLSVLHRTTQKVQVSVSDTGPGIPLEKQEQIFKDRFRLERDRAEEGYGLGLALCRRIVRAHYGQIWVDSSLTDGSCFHFTMLVYR